MTIKNKTRVRSSGAASSPRSLFALLVYALIILSAASVTRAGLNRHVMPAASGAGQSSTLMPDGQWLRTGGVAGAQVSDKVQLSGDAGSTTLPVHLTYARAGHTATLLPDGSVLIWGGHSVDGRLVRNAETYLPSTRTLGAIAINGLAPRTDHTATLLTDGRVLIAGGVMANGKSINTAQLWDAQHPARPLTLVSLVHARSGAQAQLLSDGRVLITGGGDVNEASPVPDEVFDPQTNRFSEVRDPSLLPAPAIDPDVVASIPARFAQDASITDAMALRFATVMRVETLNAKTVTLIGPAGAIAVHVVPAEAGRLLFVRSNVSLAPGTSYTLFVNGAQDVAGKTLPFTAIDFTTQTLTPKSATAPLATRSGMPSSGISSSTAAAPDTETWQPSRRAMHGDWRAHRAASRFQSLPPLQARPGVTALSGQVLKLDGNPLADVTLSIGTLTTRSDRTGRFLLQNIPSGAQVLVMDGRSAGDATHRYGYFETRTLIAAGKTTVLSYTLWMTKLDTAHAASMPAPTTAQDTVITTPLIPGLELHIPKGTIVRGPNGNIETEISITAIPVDRPPFPLPPGVPVPVYFTIQPGGSTLESADGTASHGARLIYPNFTHEAPGAHVNFWNYDPRDRGWYVYGQGTVATNGQQVIPGPGVAIYEFTGAMIINTGDGPPPNGPPPGGCGDKGGDPVNCATGLFINEQTDLVVRDVLPLAIKRTYRSNDSASRRFGVGTNDIYGTLLWSANQYQEADLVTPDGGRIHYVRTSPGTGFTDAVFECQTGPTDFYKSTINWNGNGWNLRRKDGLVYVFGEGRPLQSIHDRYGNTITLTRSGGTGGNITRVTSPNGKYIDFTYGAANRVTQAKDNLGRTVSYAYDTAGRLSTVTDAAGGITTYTYDAADNMLTVKNARGIVKVTNTYDTNGRVATQTLADSGLYRFAYTTNTGGAIIQTDITDPRGKIRRLVFNSAGYVTAETRALGLPEAQTTSYVRDSANRITSATDALGRVTSYTFDTLGNLTAITRLSGTASAVTTRYTYEPTFNQVASITDPLNHVTSFTYDGLGNLITLTDPLSHTLSFTYNSQGLPLTVTNGLNKTTQFSYDYGGLSAITDPLSRTVQLYHDGVGRMTALTDPSGARTVYQWDNLDRLLKLTNPLGNATSYAYDPNGNLTSLTDARNNKTTFSYDSKDRQASHTDALLKTETFQYDGNDNLIQYKDGKNQITTYSYDGLNRRTQTRYADASTTTNSYDAGDRLTQVIDSVSGTLTRGYDGLDRLTGETSVQGTVSYSYDAANRRTQMTVPGQSAISYAYDNANRLTTLTQGSSTVSLAYDNANRRTTLTLPNGVSMNYGYDAANALTGITYKKGTTTLGDLGYVYDNAGRRTQTTGSYARTSLPAALTSTAHNAQNQLTTWGTTALTYDANGNLTANGSKTYTWNARNQLASLSATGITAAFQYDAIGRRKTKTINGATTNYLYDGMNTVQEQSATGTVTANLLTGLGIDEVYTRSEGSVTRQLLTDALGSTVALTDTTGAVQTSYTYEPYGKTTQSGTANTNSYQYTGRENDGTGLYYYRARYYDPMLNRFIEADPIGLEAGTNLYAYALGNPVRYTDPLGLDVTVTVYPGQDGNPGGHVSINVNSNPPVGFDPAPNASTIKLLLNLPVPGIMDYVDPRRPSEGSVTIHTTTTQDQKIQAWLNNKIKHPGNYRITGPNCSTTVHDALEAGDVDSPNTMWPRDLLKGLQ